MQNRCSFDQEKAEAVDFQRLPLELGVQDESRTHTPNWALPPQSSASTNSATWTKKRAKDGTRTRDPDLGKVVLYQLSYFRSQFRPPCGGAFVNCGAKIYRLFELTKFFAKKIDLFFHTEQGEEFILTVNVLKFTAVFERDGG